MVEEQLTANAAPYEWDRPQRLRNILAAKPNGVTGRRGESIWFVNKPPGEAKSTDPYFLYLSGEYVIFSGADFTSSTIIDIAYLQYSRKFAYYEAASRPATYDDETETWTYHEDYDIDDDTRQTARDLVTNWLIFRWYDTLLEGTLAKLFKTVKDERASSTFGLYKSLQKDILKGERLITIRDPDRNG